MRKERTFCKASRSIQNILELQCSVDDSVELSMFLNVFTLDILFDEVDRGLGHEIKHFIRYHLYHFLQKLLPVT